MVKDILIENFDYNLPDERIAKFPLQKRDACKLIVNDVDGSIFHHHFSDLPRLLDPETLMVCNETRVINARMEFHKATGARIEIFILEPLDPVDYTLSFAARSRCEWSCLVGNLKKWKEGSIEKQLTVTMPDETSRELTLTATLNGRGEGDSLSVVFTWDDPEVTFASIVEAAGNIPIPPYLNRESQESDTNDYQTVFSRVQGSVAAPTAGLHFTDELLDELERSGVEIEHLTLHVGAGTFQPVKSASIGEHPMHTETFSVSRDLIESILLALEDKRTILAVGTTSVRTLESLPYLGMLISKGDFSMHISQWLAYETEDFSTEEAIEAIAEYMDCEEINSLTASTAIMIAPGFKWRIVKRMITNFHQPQSTLLLLVGSFLEGKNADKEGAYWKKLYAEAMARDYRFLSYGDACLLTPLFPAPEKEIEIPFSKSMLLRGMTLDFTARRLFSECPNEYPDVCDDTRSLLHGIGLLESSVDATEPVVINTGDGAAPFRFLMAIAASLPGSNVALVPSEALGKRPHNTLVETLSSLGADIKVKDGVFHIKGKNIEGGEIEVDSTCSSQYVSALMMAAPVWHNGVKIKFSGTPVSFSYLKMTASMMLDYGFDVELDTEHVRVSRGITPGVCGVRNVVEGDWSAASYFYEWAALNPGVSIRIRGLVSPEKSLQGDAACADLFKMLNVFSMYGKDEKGPYADILCEGPSEVPILEMKVDMMGVPDLVPAFVATLVAHRIVFELNGISHLRYKESDRIEAITEELEKMGIFINSDQNSMWIADARPCPEKASFDSHGDHRIVMALAPLSNPADTISGEECVAKSFPDFRNQMEKLQPIFTPVKK